MPGHRSAAAGERVVEAQAELDEEGAALAGPARAVGEEAERGVEEAGERREDRDRGLERLDVVRRDAQEPVALGHGLSHEPELAVLEVADAAVDHVRGRPRGALAVVAALDEGDVDALQREVAEGADAVDPAPDDEDGGAGRGPEGGGLRPGCWVLLGAGRLLCHGTSPWGGDLGALVAILRAGAKEDQPACTNVQEGVR